MYIKNHVLLDLRNTNEKHNQNYIRSTFLVTVSFVEVS